MLTGYDNAPNLSRMEPTHMTTKTKTQIKFEEAKAAMNAHPAFGKDFNNPEVKSLMRKMAIWQKRVAVENYKAEKLKRPTAFRIELSR